MALLLAAWMIPVGPSAAADSAGLGSALPGTRLSPPAPRQDASLTGPAQALVSQDPLTRRILKEQVTHQNGGVTGFVRLPTGQGIELRAVDLGPMPLTGAVAAAPARVPTALTPAPGLAAGPEASAAPLAPRRPAKAAAEQLKVLDRQNRGQNWNGEAAPVRAAPRKKKAAPPEQLY